MKPWMGAAAVAAAMLLVPSAAFAGPDDPALVKFQLPNASAAEFAKFEALGYELNHAVDPGPNGTSIVQAWVTDEELPLLRAQGYPDVGVVHDKYNIDKVRAEIAQDAENETAAKLALQVNTAGVKGKSAAPGTVRAQRADAYENNVGRFISVEANTTEAKVTCATPPFGNCSYTGPVLVASVYDASGNRIGGGNLLTYIDGDPPATADYYQYHYQIFRLGNKGDGGAEAATVKIAAPNGDVDTIAAKQWVSKNPPGYSATFKHDFNTRYYNAQEGFERVKALATEFPNIAKTIDLPEQTWGYQRKAQTMLGYQVANFVTFDANNLPVAGTVPPAPTNGPTPGLSPEGNRTVVLTSKAWGHEGGNGITAQLLKPAANDSPLGVTVADRAITVSLATDGGGAITSTAQQVINAINAHPAASALVTASKFRLNAGSGVVMASAVSPLHDLLRAPATVKRGPQTQTMLRIGNDVGKPQGQKVGVYVYCQEHGGEIATSGVCLETAERLVRNYGTDAKTTSYVDNLDIFIVPMINADGATHSIYDSPRRTNMANYCTDTVKYPENDTDPGRRNNWGVNINRNFSVGSAYDGYFGASTTGCYGSNFAGPFELSEPETRNEIWVQNTFKNIKFSNNIHSSGGYFMWVPGSYTPDRTTLPYPPYGTLNFFDQTASHVLDGIKSHRGTAIRPQRTGPVIDVLYSAAGNSADEAWYVNGIVGYDFEIGDVHYNDTGTGTATCDPGQQPPFANGGAAATNNCLLNEGKHEGEEFASGNYGLLQSALDYQNDTVAPVVEPIVEADGITPVYSVRFKSNEASSIYYTTDGSTPTTASTEWKPPRARALPLPLQLAPGTNLKWIATDFRGNVSAVKAQVLGRVDTPGTVGGSVGATLSLTLGAPARFEAFTPGVTKPYEASTSATVISTAGDALLSVADPSSNNTGKLVNGAFALAQPLQARGRNAANTTTTYANVGSSASPLSLLTYAAPTSNDTVSLDFSQLINANDPLRTGTYSKALTFTLSTTTP